MASKLARSTLTSPGLIRVNLNPVGQFSRPEESNTFFIGPFASPIRKILKFSEFWWVLYHVNIWLIQESGGYNKILFYEYCVILVLLWILMLPFSLKYFFGRMNTKRVVRAWVLVQNNIIILYYLYSVFLLQRRKWCVKRTAHRHTVEYFIIFTFFSWWTEMFMFSFFIYHSIAHAFLFVKYLYL